MRGEVGLLTCSVREARDSFSSLRRRAAAGEEIIIIPERAEGESAPVSLVPTWFLDDLVARTTDWRVSVLSRPGTPVSHWEPDGASVRERPESEYSAGYVLEHEATGITGAGKTRAEAIDSLLQGLCEYAEEYYSDLPFYLSPRSGRRDHYAYVRTVKRYAGDLSALKAILKIAEPVG